MEQKIHQGGSALLNPLDILKGLDIKESYCVADLGCGGNGHFVAPLASLVGKNGKIYALDIQKNVLDALKARLKLEGVENVELVWSDLEQVGAASIPEGSCDLVIIINVLFQNLKHEEILKEAQRFAKKGGRLVVIDWKYSASPFGPPIDIRVAPMSVKTLCSGLGLKLFHEFDAGQYHYALVFLKP